MRSLTTVILTALCVLLPSASVAIAASPAPLAPPTLPAPTTDRRAPATLGERASFRFLPLGAGLAATKDARAKTGTATLSGEVYWEPWQPLSDAAVEWYVPVDGVWQHGSTLTDASGAYSFTGVPEAVANGELWCDLFGPGTTRLALLGRTSASWPDAVSTTFDFRPSDFRAQLTAGGPWSDWETLSIWLYGRDALSDLIGAGSRDKYTSGPVKALPGLYDKAAVYWWANEGKEVDVRLRRVPTDGDVVDVEFIDQMTGRMLVNTGLYDDRANVVLSTTDAGLSWSPSIVAPDTHLKDFVFTDATLGWAVGSDIHLIDYNYVESAVIMRTDDGGQTWTPQTSPVTSPLCAVDFVDATHGWAVGEDGVIVATTDGGMTWTVQASDGVITLNDVDFCDAMHGWAVGQNGVILATSDGGATWTPQVAGTAWNLGAVHSSDATHACVVGQSGIALWTADGGASWSESSSWLGFSALALDFADASTGWAVGVGGGVSKTTDGGATWTVQRSAETFGVRHLETVVAIDGSRAWAGGTYGFVTDTENGGAVWSDESFAADETYAQRFTVSSKLGASGNPGSTVKLTFTNFPKGYVSLLKGDPEYPASAAVRSLGTYTSKGGTKETKSITVPKTAKPGYTYWFATKNANGVLYLEAPFQVSRLTASRTTVSPGGSVKLTGIVPTEGHWGSTAGKVKRCALFRSTRSATAGYKFVKYVRANGYGVFNAGYQKPARTTWYLVYYPGDKWYWADVTTPVKITVR